MYRLQFALPLNPLLFLFLSWFRRNPPRLEPPVPIPCNDDNDTDHSMTVFPYLKVILLVLFILIVVNFIWWMFEYPNKTQQRFTDSDVLAPCGNNLLVFSVSIMISCRCCICFGHFCKAPLSFSHLRHEFSSVFDFRYIRFYIVKPEPWIRTILTYLHPFVVSIATPSWLRRRQLFVATWRQSLWRHHFRQPGDWTPRSDAVSGRKWTLQHQPHPWRQTPLRRRSPRYHVTSGAGRTS